MSSNDNDPPQVLGATAIKPVQRTRWESFKLFLYDREKGAFMYRTPKSWLLIFIFYVTLYSCLLAFWFSLLQIFMLTLNEETPKYILKDSLIGNQPGIGVRPRQPSVNIGSSLIYVRGDWDGTTVGGEDEDSDAGYARRLQMYLNDTYINGQEDAIDCTDVELSRERPRDAKPCRFDPKIYGDCSQYPYGFSKNNLAPCVFVKLNKIFEFSPEPLAPEDVVNNTDIPPEIRADIMDPLKPRKIYIECGGEFPADVEAVESSDLEFFPSDRGLYPAFFPYRSKSVLASPAVAVKFKNIPRGQMLHVECKAWYKNVVHDKKEGKGMARFEFIVDTANDS